MKEIFTLLILAFICGIYSSENDEISTYTVDPYQPQEIGKDIPEGIYMVEIMSQNDESQVQVSTINSKDTNKNYQSIEEFDGMKVEFIEGTIISSDVTVNLYESKK